MAITTGILIFDDAEELDFAGPWEVFTMARMGGHMDDKVVTIAERAGAVRAHKGMRVLPDHTFADAPRLDVLIVSGGLGTQREVDNPALIEWLRKAAEPCTWVASVCTGAFLLHRAGLARGRRVTTHWAFCETLRREGGAEVIEKVRFVQDGKLVTAAGVSAGIDMALWLVGQIHGVDHARQTQRLMEYDPAPPYAAAG
ncbi:MAG TPA: DJ-1/PfpI family protein [Haliangium sp.]|nr:DJ-1/PfpI family protein [Haliangium sp.]